MITDLSPNFTMAEAVGSAIARKWGIDNRPDAGQLENIFWTAHQLEKVREILGGFPVVVTSWFRSPELNRKVGGVENSAHLSGLAVDFVVPKFGTPGEVWGALEASGWRGFDQLIDECGRWVHIGFEGDPMRGHAFRVQP